MPLCLLADIQLPHTQLARVHGPAWPDFPWNAFKLAGAILACSAFLPFCAPRQTDTSRSLHWTVFSMQIFAACFFGAMLWPFLSAPFMQSKTRELAGLSMYIEPAEASRLNDEPA